MSERGVGDIDDGLLLRSDGNERLRVVGIAPKFWAELPVAAVGLINDEMARTPAVAWVVVIAPFDEVARIVERLVSEADSARTRKRPAA